MPSIPSPSAIITPPSEYHLSGPELHKLFAEEAGRSAPGNLKLQEQGSFFADALLRHRKSPELPSIGALPRSTLPADSINDKTMNRLGFLPSYVAVPERGQTELRTWRHPYTGMHLHRHGPRWIFHEDSWPSLSMQMAKFKEQNPHASFKDTAAYSAKALFRDSAPHIVYEGAPGYVNYAYNTILGNPSFSSSLDHKGDLKTLADKLGRGVAASALLGAAYSGLGYNPKNFYKGTGAGLGFLGGNVLSDYLQRGVYSVNPDLQKPGPANLLMAAGIPLATTIAGSSLGGRLYNAVRDRRRRDARERAEKKKRQKQQPSSGFGRLLGIAPA